ncbi:general odorant-binding protein 56a [Colletes gigas]|uniref:general odorant-binding protein 56a n=1 Tax=Colletes gigas TaxID=935657 RepID=UPI001C9BA8B6|nr:general odorant-binding protein 56a [Colletes gigas]
MKTVAIFFVFFVASALAGITDEQKEKLFQFKDECMADTKVDSEMIHKALAGDDTENEGKLQCFAACILKKIGIMEQDGSINVEVVKKNAPADVPNEQIEEVLNKCKDITGATDCEKAGNLVKCFLENKTFNILS